MSERSLPHVLGAMFLAVVVTSLAGGVLLGTVAGGVFGTVSTPDLLNHVASNTGVVRASILADLVTSVGEIALGVLLYSVLRDQGRVLALIALGCFFGEALSLGVSKAGTMALIDVSRQWVAAGSPTASAYLPLGDVLYTDITIRLGATTQMFFYCTGGLIWYSMFWRSRYVPRVISGFGVLAVAAGLVGILLQFTGTSVSPYVFLPILPFEIAIGGWLLAKGIRSEEAEPVAPAGQRRLAL